MKHQGWTNYETYVISLMLDDNRPAHDYWRATAASILEELDGNTEEATIGLANAMREEISDSIPDLEGFWADLLDGALGEVDWHEIAKHWINAVATV